jgi:hypothetical protein
MKSKYLDTMKDFQDDQLLAKIEKAEKTIAKLKEYAKYPRAQSFVPKFGVTKQAVREMLFYLRKKGKIESFYAEDEIIYTKPAKTKRYRLVSP